MIEKVLIANRGEIALRVIRTCKALGIKTVAVYSDEDTNSMHVKQATEAYHIGEATPAKSYLNQEKILDVILSSGADSVHPGYGFLSENDDFARLCEKNKITFIGPSADSMNLCGDKMECKAAMLKAEVPTVPGSPGLVKDAEDAAKVANDIGYPVMLKSVYGGGGRGIRIVTNDKELHEGFETVTSESIAAVGKSGAGISLMRSSIVALSLSKTSRQPSMTSFKLCGGMLVAIPTAIPADPLINKFGSLVGKTAGSCSDSS